MERQPVECARTGDVTNFDKFPGMEGIVVTLNCFFLLLKSNTFLYDVNLTSNSDECLSLSAD